MAILGGSAPEQRKPKGDESIFLLHKLLEVEARRPGVVFAATDGTRILIPDEGFRLASACLYHDGTQLRTLGGQMERFDDLVEFERH